MSIRVALIEDDPDIRQLLQLLLRSTPGYQCEQAYQDCQTGLPAILNNPPDVLLMDIDLPGISGIEGVAQLKQKLPDLNIIMLTVHEDDEAIFAALCAGAVGYLTKGLPPVRLLQAIEDVQAGGAPMSPIIARKVVHTFQPQPSPILSPREQEVLTLLCEGDNYSTIAEKLFISGHTVRSHIKSIYQKLEVNSRAAVVRKATQNRLI